MTDRILIVDDEKDTREFMARALSGKENMGTHPLGKLDKLKRVGR